MALARVPFVVVLALLAGVTVGLFAGGRRAAPKPPPRTGVARLPAPAPPSPTPERDSGAPSAPVGPEKELAEWMSNRPPMAEGREARDAYLIAFTERFPGLRAEWFRNPSAFFARFRDPANADRLQELALGLLVMRPLSDGRWDPWTLPAKAYPRPLLERLAGFLKDGTPGQKQAVLEFLKWVEVQPAFLADATADLLTDPEPSVQARALGVVVRHDHPVPERCREMLLRSLHATAPGEERRRQLLEALSLVSSEQADRDLADLLQREDDRPKVAACLADRLSRGHERGGTPYGAGLSADAAEACFASFQQAVSLPSADVSFTLSCLRAAVSISPGRAAPLIQLAKSGVPAERHESFDQVLEAIAQGRPHGEIVRLSARYW